MGRRRRRRRRRRGRGGGGWGRRPGGGGRGGAGGVVPPTGYGGSGNESRCLKGAGNPAARPDQATFEEVTEPRDDGAHGRAHLGTGRGGSGSGAAGRETE